MNLKTLRGNVAWELLAARFTVEAPMTEDTLWATRFKNSIRVTVCPAGTRAAVAKIIKQFGDDAGGKRLCVVIVPGSRVPTAIRTLAKESFVAVFPLANMRRNILSLSGSGIQAALTKPKVKKPKTTKSA